jgi:hypothetical protein
MEFLVLRSILMEPDRYFSPFRARSENGCVHYPERSVVYTNRIVVFVRRLQTIDGSIHGKLRL